MNVVIRMTQTRLQQYVRDAPEKMNTAISIFQQEGGAVSLETLRSNIPIRTGMMRESAFLRLTPKGFSVGVAHNAARYVDQGTAPHTIFPRTANVLHWFDAFGGEHFAKSVQHPGFFGRHFIEKTRDFLRLEMCELWREILERCFNR